MIITETKDYNKIKFILSDPILFETIYGEDGKIEFENEKYLLVTDNTELVGIFMYKEFTKVTVDAHFAVLPKYWKNSKEVLNLAENWAKNHGYTAALTSVPANCVHMLKFMKRMDFIPVGMIKNGIVYHKQLVDLFLYYKQL